MRRRLPRRVLMALVIGLCVALVAGVVLGVRWWREAHRADLTRAVSMAPASSERLSWTDWQAVRRTLDVAPDADLSGDELTQFLDDAFARDLSTSSALVESTPTLAAEFGFSPATIDWELLAQGPDGAVDILGFPDDTDFDELGDTLESLGFTRPDDVQGTWLGGPDVLVQIGPALTPELQYVALLPDAGIVLTSDTQPYLEEAVEAATGDAPVISSDDDMTQVVSDLVDGDDGPLVAAVFTGNYACERLAMAAADDTDQAQAADLIERAGGVHPLAGFAMGTQPSGKVRVSMSFESDEAAREDADSRAALASGPAPGQGGDFDDRFAVASATADGPLVRLELDPVDGQYVLSDLTSGPVLFASC